MNTSSKSITKQILILAFPIILENLLQALLGTVDTWFAGKINDTAIAAIGAATLTVNLFLVFYTAVGVGTSALISRFVGERNPEKAGRAAAQSILLSLILGMILGLTALVFRREILTISGAEDAVLAAAEPYYLIVAVPSVFACLVLVLSACLRASKDTVTPMLVSAGANVLNIALDAVFLKLGMGIAGLALATTMSRMVSAVILFFRLFRGKGIFCLSPSVFRPNREMLLQITKIAVPAGVERLLMRTGQLVYNGFIFSIGTGAYVAHSVAGSIEYYTYIPAFGFSAAAATLVGISLGEKNQEEARDIAWKTWFCANAVMIPMGIVFFTASPMLAAQFTKTPDVQQLVAQVLRLIAFFQPAIAFSNVFEGALQGAGDTKFPMYATFFGTWVVHIGLGWLLGVRIGWGLFGIWMGYAMNNVVRSILLYIRFRWGRWTEISL